MALGNSNKALHLHFYSFNLIYSFLYVQII